MHLFKLDFVADGISLVHFGGAFCYGEKLQLVTRNEKVNGLLYSIILQENLHPWPRQMLDRLLDISNGNYQHIEHQ